MTDPHRLRVGLDVLFFPFFYHAELQRLGLVAARPFLPPWKSLIPFSASSPITPFSVHHDSTTSVSSFMKATFTSPLVLMCAGHFYERWAYSAVNDAVDTSLIRPVRADIVSSEVDTKNRLTTILGLRRPSPPLVRKAIHALLSALGWAAPETTGETVQSSPPDLTRPVPLTEGQTIEVGGTTVTNIAPLELAVAHPEAHVDEDQLDVERIAVQAAVLDGTERPRSPVTPGTSGVQFDGDDPRIRITRREGTIEMEVRLPPRTISASTEIAGATVPLPNPPVPQSQNAAPSPSPPQHRVSELSLISSRMVGLIVKSQLIGLAMLPVKIVGLRLIASHYLASQSDLASPRAVTPLPDLQDLTWRSVGIQLSRVALCHVLELAVDLGLWGLQYAISLNIGKRHFDWGAL